MSGRTREWTNSITSGGAAYPLVVLFGLNMVDELDRTAFGVLLPEIRDDFGLDLQGILTLVGLVSLAALLLQVPIAAYADRHNRVRVAWVGAVGWGLCSLLTGMSATLWMLGATRAGSAIGRAVVDPTHGSLLSDYYPPEARPKVFSAHRAANAVGQFVGPVTAAFLAAATSWRVPFILYAFPTAIFVVLAWRLDEPVRGAHERRAVGADEATIAMEEAAPSFAEGWRIVWRIETLRRIWWSLPFLAASLIGFASLASLVYDDVFGLTVRQRGLAAAAAEPWALIGLVIGARMATRLMAKGPEHILGFLSKTAWVVSVALLVFAAAPNVWVAIAAHSVITATLAVLAPGILATLSLAIPPRARSMGFAVGSLWVIPGLVVLPVIGWLGDQVGLRWGMLVMVPIFVIGGALISTSKDTIAPDIAEVWRATAARSEVAYDRRLGQAPLLVARGVEVGYDGVQVLFGIDLDVEEGEILALLGTNGAGKSTLLKAICGVAEADRGAIIFDGREITHAPPHEIAALDVRLMQGGAGIFASLTVEENLRTAAWLQRKDKDHLRDVVAGALAPFPALEERRAEPAGNLSGGQQQQLALAMALLARPRLLLVDELSLGLAPLIVSHLLPLLSEARDAGCTIVLVEQSADVALAVADRAVFLEKGEVRFHGPAADLRGRTDLLRAVFLPSGPPAGDNTAAATDGMVVHDPGEVADDIRLRTAGVTVDFGGNRAVNAVTIEVVAGEIVGLIGPNGAGKTTLFDLLSGYLPPDHGRIFLGEHDVTSAGPDERARAGLGRSFQDARLFPSLTVEEAIAVACERWIQVRDPLSAALRLPWSYDSERHITDRVAELVELLNLGPHRSKLIRELSTGTRRVVDLACLLAHRPTVILLDEPSSGIAQRESEALGPLLRRIRDDTGASLVVVEHDIPLVRDVADRIVAMDRGEIIANGTPDDVLSHPAVITAYLGIDAVSIERSAPTTTTD
jgi:ABC-type branched-subunit amino acid transport system ATPase component/sugar phosphate permease